MQTNIKRGGGFCAFRRQDHAFILTCAHVVEDAAFVSVNGKNAEVVYFKHNKEEDLALLKVYDKDASFVPIAIADELNGMSVYCYYFNGYKIKSYNGKLLTTKKTLVSIPQGEKGQSGAALLQNGFVIGVASALDKEENAEALISQRVTNSKLNEIQKETK